jgi:hypothetical protein
MRNVFRSTVAIAIGLTAAFGGQRARADAAATPPTTLAVLNLDYVDTSGEPTDQTAVHQRRQRILSARCSAISRRTVSAASFRCLAGPSRAHR